MGACSLPNIKDRRWTPFERLAARERCSLVLCPDRFTPCAILV